MISNGLAVRLIGWLGIALLLVGSYVGLFVAPPERHMGEVQRIMYVHVPSAWIALLAFTAAFGFAIASLWSSRPRWDNLMTGAVHIGVILNALLLLQGMIWARATWGVWWDWDVRLTTSLVMALLFAGILALRSFVSESGQRASWSAIATIVAFVDVPLVYFCVRWWRSLHQIQSSPDTMDPLMVLPLRINSFGMLAVAIWFTMRRARVEELRRLEEEVAPPEVQTVEEVEHA
jgi:heme exporter protein C